MMPQYPTIDATIGDTPLVRLQRIGAAASAARGNVILAKLEGNNPGGSVKDRPARSMLAGAERSGRIKPGDRLIEADGKPAILDRATWNEIFYGADGTKVNVVVARDGLKKTIVLTLRPILK